MAYRNYIEEDPVRVLIDIEEYERDRRKEKIVYKTKFWTHVFAAAAGSAVSTLLINHVSKAKSFGSGTGIGKPL